MPIEHFITAVEKAFRDSVCPLLVPGERSQKKYMDEWLTVLAARDNAIAALALMNRPDIDAKVLGTFSALEAYLARIAIPGVDNLKYDRDVKSLAEVFHNQLEMLRPYRLVVASDSHPAPQSPLWRQIEAELITAGHDPERLATITAPALLALVEKTRRADKPAGPCLTVTHAAELLMKDVPSLDLHNAKARVSKAASTGRLKTNGEKGTARRIDPVSFDAWRLKQRDRDLDAQDE